MYCQIFIPNHSPHCHMVSQWPTNRAWLRKLYDPLSLQNETTLNYTVATQFCFFLASMFLDYINILLKKSNVNAEKYFFFWKIFLYSDVLLPFSDLVIASSAIYLQLSSSSFPNKAMLLLDQRLLNYFGFSGSLKSWWSL